MQANFLTVVLPAPSVPDWENPEVFQRNRTTPYAAFVRLPAQPQPQRQLEI